MLFSEIFQFQPAGKKFIYLIKAGIFCPVLINIYYLWMHKLS